jgi:hypothetical protein
VEISGSRCAANPPGSEADGVAGVLLVKHRHFAAARGLADVVGFAPRSMTAEALRGLAVLSILTTYLS